MEINNLTGAVDLPGTTWRDRPAIDRGNGIFLAGDQVAAPGLLSEVAFASASRAAAGRLPMRGAGHKRMPKVFRAIHPDICHGELTTIFTIGLITASIHALSSSREQTPARLTSPGTFAHASTTPPPWRRTNGPETLPP